jgi:hypothetical protein
MPAARKSSARSPRATTDTRKRYEQNGRAIDRIAKSLEVAQTDLSALGGTMGSGVSDLRKDVARLLRDARRDVGKLSKAVKRDLDRIQKDLASTASKPTPRPRRGGRTGTASRSSTRSARRATTKR